MVYQKVGRGQAVRRRRKNYSWLFLVLLTIFAATFTIILYLMFFDSTESQAESDIGNAAKESASQSSENIEVKPEKIDFQPVVDAWVKTVGGNKSVLIYDLDRDEIAGEYNTEETYNTASLYKLFVVYEGYRRLESGEWQASAKAGATGYTISECLDLAIRESYSPCAETLHKMIGYNELEKIVEEDFAIHNTDVEGLSSNAEDITKMMKLFYGHPDVKKDTLIAQMQDSFLNQPETTYDWRQGLPSGFSGRANVYNKVGWSYNEEEGAWDVYHDAAIVEFPEKNRHFIVVVMTNKVPFQQIRKLGTMIESEFNKY